MPNDRALLKILILFVSSGLSILACTLPQAGQPQPTDTLSVTSTTPANGDSHVDPGVIITVVFNEAVDVATLMGQQNLVQIAPLPPSMDLSLASDSRTLSITVHPFLASATQYSVEIQQGVKSASGSTLASPDKWSFTTGSNMPAADVEVDANPFQGKEYTNASTVSLLIPCNLSPGTIYLASTQAGLSSAPPATGVTWASSTATVPWSLDVSVQGPQTVWVQYQGAPTGPRSIPRSATVIRDVTPPVLSPFPSAILYFNASGTPVTPPPVIVNKTVASYSWSSVPPAAFAPSSGSPSPAITPSGAEGTYTVQLVVTDPAGNVSLPQSFTIVKDTVPPGTPTAQQIVNNQTTTLSLSPTWQYPTPASDDPGDSYVVQLSKMVSNTSTVLESITIPVPTTKSPGNWTPQSPLPGDGSYTLKIWQMDLAGNKSVIPYKLDFTVTPVIPVDGSAVSGKTLVFQWRDFGGGAPYVAHLGQLDANNQFVEEASASLPTAEWQTTGVTAGDKVWYIEAGSPTTRSPSTAGTYYHFTAQ